MGFYSTVIFPRIMDFFMSRGSFGGYRKTALLDVSGKTLEVGFGTGLNLPHYPDACGHITAIDPNEGVRKIAEPRIAKSGKDISFLTLNGERLDLNDDDFENVVSTWTLCSIPDVARAMLEARRVLKPGGRFVFIEHGLSDRPRTQKWQRRLTPIQKIIGDGCHLDRDIESIVRQSGLKIVKMERFEVPRAPGIVGSMYMGVAIKE